MSTEIDFEVHLLMKTIMNKIKSKVSGTIIIRSWLLRKFDAPFLFMTRSVVRKFNSFPAGTFFEIYTWLCKLRIWIHFFLISYLWWWIADPSLHHFQFFHYLHNTGLRAFCTTLVSCFEGVYKYDRPWQHVFFVQWACWIFRQCE